jgi:hypothetical protein
MTAIKENALSAKLVFEPIPDSRSRTFRLRVRSSDATPGRAFELWLRQEWRDWINQAIARAESREFDPKLVHADVAKWWLTRAGERLDGELYLDLGFAAHRFREEKRIGPFVLHGILGSKGRFRTVAEVGGISTDADHSWQRVTDATFDPAMSVQIEEYGFVNVSGPPAGSPVGTVEILSESAGRISLRARDCPAPCSWLIASQPWYPGWTALVNGRSKAIFRANYAFNAIELPPGDSTIVLEYDAPVFRFACWLALGTTIALAVWLYASRRA